MFHSLMTTCLLKPGREAFAAARYPKLTREDQGRRVLCLNTTKMFVLYISFFLCKKLGPWSDSEIPIR